MHWLARLIDRFTDITGALIAWLSLALVVVTFTVVVLRYAFGTGSIALQESVTYLHAALFMLGMAYTLKRGGHVRVDVFYRRFTARTRALVDIAGGVLFLLPVSVLILVLCWDYVTSSWAIRETSGDANGLPWVYALKTLLVVMPVILILQGVAEILNNLLFVLGRDGHTSANVREPL